LSSIGAVKPAVSRPSTPLFMSDDDVSSAVVLLWMEMDGFL
jgi:hypothetical protein